MLEKHYVDSTEFYFKNRCQCKEIKAKVKEEEERKLINRREGSPLEYPKINKLPFRTFQIKYEKKLSSTAKSILNSFQKKYLYYAMDDILYLLKENPSEQENILAILYSPVLSLQNNFSINFFDIWIHEIYIEEILKSNKFLANNFQTSEQTYSITLKLFYKIKVPVKKQEFLW